MAKGERKIQTAIMSMLMDLPMVAHAHVTTNGLFKGKGGGAWLNIGYPGQLDIVGQLRDGRYFAIEVKTPGEEPTELQDNEINFITRNNGVAGWADNVEDANRIIELCCRPEKSQLCDDINRHLDQLSPHIQQRETSKLLRRAVDELTSL